MSEPVTSGAFIAGMLTNGATDDQIISALAGRFPNQKCGTDGRSAKQQIAWYRSRLNTGRLKVQFDADGTPRILRNGQEAEDALLDFPLAVELADACEKLHTEGKLPSRERLAGYCETFRQKFGPESLLKLDGEALLEKMHVHGNQDSLVYWLEFKNDEELPAIFGGIAGGNALNFGIYRRKETGEWMTGSPHKQMVISIEEAVQFARKHRDQLVKAAGVLERFDGDASDEAYGLLQAELEQTAPDVSDSAWGHKYLTLLYPDKLDDFHSPLWQRFNLIKCLQLPPQGTGRYLSAGRFVRMARQLDVPMNWLTTTLNRRNGIRHRYWRVGTSTGEERRNRWSLMRDGDCMAVGWPKLGNVIPIRDEPNAVEILKAAIAEHYPSAPQNIGRSARQLRRFLKVITVPDLVIAMDGTTVLGIGRVTGDVYYEPSSDFPFRRPVEWLDLGEWTFPEMEGLRTTVHEFRKDINLVEIERRLFDPSREIPPPQKTQVTSTGKSPRLDGIPGRIQAVLDRKSQVILYGPPGTGKTYWAEKTAHDLAAIDSFGVVFEALSPEQKQLILDGRVQACCFHPAYGYEDFLEGYRPEQENGSMTFLRRPGIFRRLCEDAAAEPSRRFFLIIDEINRGDIPRIFGELMMVLEKNKRGKSILLPVSGEPFRVPPNVHIIGTMNTADRSISLLDTALRRRFGFIELMPDYDLFKGTVVAGIPLGPWLEALNQRICQHIGRDARNLQVGHSYLMEGERPINDFSRFARVVQDDIIPLLEEYCYEDYTILERILGKGLVNGATQTIRHELFAGDMREELIQVLLAPCPDIAASAQAITSDAEDESVEDELEGDDMMEVA